ncbi:heavy metal translocating P-type ATPase [Ktedonobacter racemifer]|uniref:Copper-exporting P-type ATPase n=1 Tax=Ktedonobacter racemifer DSM 44963 TaxID=485913 RepID=D6TS33_KTERA|nr:heavy metal translocating P-type ATPase [Ktedonobacter racemifer]EFH86106.1 heavy metal translocating P-type ATPase [Ktedonobacter racemifer DSM 44963]
MNDLVPPDSRRLMEFSVRGMDCAECTQHVQYALSALPGVQEAQVYLSSEKAVVRYDPTVVNTSAFRQAVEGAGYTLVLPLRTVEMKIAGMDCTECTQHVQHALATLPGVASAQVYLSSEKAVIQYDPTQVTLPAFHQAVEAAGYSIVSEGAVQEGTSASPTLGSFTRPILTLFALVFGVVLLVVIVGEWLGWMERITDLVPWYVGWALVLLAGSPIFWNVIKAALRRQVISHTLMSLGVLAALIVGQWTTAAVVVFFMHIGNFAENFTTERSRRALKHLTSMAPKTARLEREGSEMEFPMSEVQQGDIVIVRPGEAIPVDGVVISGQATINQAAITGESMPIEVEQGHHVFAATIATLGSLRIQTTQVGTETTFGRVIKMVEEAEAHRADVQRLADRFSAYFLPLVASIAALTFLISRNPLATASVLVVACSCSLALATPVAMLASIGAAAKRGLLIKGGKYLEVLARADVLLLDKTGTVTVGRPQITDIVAIGSLTSSEVLQLAASAERYSEHPLAEAVRAKATEEKIILLSTEQFEAIPGQGIRARVSGRALVVGNARLIPSGLDLVESTQLEAQGKTLLFIEQDGELVGLLGASDTVRPEVPEALAEVKRQGVKRIELLTGDNERVASALAHQLGIGYQANLLPEDKIRLVKEYQTKGHTVVMVGDGVNDAPALAQADVGMAMGVAGTDVAMDAAHMALMRNDWRLVPEAFAIAHRTMRVVKMNIGFTALYNLVGLSLAAFGLLPPILAAAAQSLPDLGILANSSRLLRQKRPVLVHKEKG